MLLQSELFVLLTGQYQYWHQTLAQQLAQVTEHSQQSQQVATLVKLWSNLLAIAQQTEWLLLQQNPATPQVAQSPDSAVDCIDVTPLLEQTVYQSALTLDAEVDLRSHLPSPLLLTGPAELWSLLGLAISSFLILGSAGRQRTIFLSGRSLSATQAQPQTVLQAATPYQALEWSLLQQEQLAPLQFGRDNQALFGFRSGMRRAGGCGT